MDDKVIIALQEKLAKQHRSIRFLTGVLLMVVLFVLAFSALVSKGVTKTCQEKHETLSVKGIIIVDEQDHPRILLGNPVPQVGGRKSKDLTHGIVVLDEQGVDRLSLGYALPDPTVLGKAVRRIELEAGIVINDGQGTERTGWGVFESGKVVLGIDHPNGREGIVLALEPGKNCFIGMQGEAGGYERLGLYVDADVSLIKLADTTGLERLIMQVEMQSPAKILKLTPQGGDSK